MPWKYNPFTEELDYYSVYVDTAGNPVLSKLSGTGIKVDTEAPTFGWRDLLSNISGAGKSINPPTSLTYRGGQIHEWAFAAGEGADFEFHLPHDYVPGTNLFVHVHWSHNGTAISGNIVMDCYSTYAKGHNQQIFPAEKNVTITFDTVDITTTPQYSHRLNEVQLSTSGGSATLLDTDLLEPDGLVLMRVQTTTIPTIIGGAAKPFLHFVDIHYQSTNIATKQKAPNFYV